MLTDLLVDIGGISRAFVALGLFLAQFAARHLYRAALIKDLFMVQEDSKPLHPSVTNYNKRAEKKQSKSGSQLMDNTVLAKQVANAKNSFLDKRTKRSSLVSAVVSDDDEPPRNVNNFEGQ